jgi:hypothetical protein
MVSIMRYIRGFQMKKSIGLSITFVLAMAGLVAARQNTELLPGSVQIQEDVNAVVCNDKDEKFTIVGSKEPARLAAGKYYIDSWILERTDKNGAVWKLEAKDVASRKTFNIAEDAEAKLPIGEPIVSTLTVRKEDSEFYFRHYFKGQLGEEIELTKNQSRADPPKLLVRNEDGSYQESLTFKYG